MKDILVCILEYLLEDLIKIKDQDDPYAHLKQSPH